MEPAGRGGAAGAVDGLREAYLAVEAAYDRAAEQLHGVTHPLPRLTLASWDDAIGQAGAALAAVRCGLAEARTLPGVPLATVGGVITRLRAARREAVRAAGLLPPLRRRLATALDLTRRDATTPAAHAAAHDWGLAITRIDLAAARLAVGTVALDRYLHNLGDPGAGPVSPAKPTATGATAAVASAADIAAGARTVGLAVLLVHPWQGWRGILARVWHDYRTDQELLRRYLRWR